MTGSPLRDALQIPGRSLTSLTVLSTDNDPFRLDTPANHRDGRWLATQIDAHGLTGRTIHLRGLHYALLGCTRPNGKQYVNDESNWKWLSETCAKAARWLGYVPWEQITDQRNDEPVIIEHTPPDPRGYVLLGGLDITVPHPDDLEPIIGASGFRGVQPYKLVMYGEKSSLRPVLEPLARLYQADLYLPSGEISDTLMHRMTEVAASDGRPMVVFTFSDCDPSGWQMQVSIGRKLQAFQALRHPGLQYVMHHVALHPAQVKEYNLPSTPLKDTEKRAAGWLAAYGVEQTEIDSLATLQPALLRDLAVDMIWHYYDTSLDVRVNQARAAWEAEAQRRLDAAITPGVRQWFREQAEARLADLREQVAAIEAELRLDPGDIDLPPIEVPAAVIPPEPATRPLIDSRWTFAEQCDALKAAKEYRQ